MDLDLPLILVNQRFAVSGLYLVSCVAYEDCFEIQVAHFVADDRCLLIVESTGHKTYGNASGGCRCWWMRRRGNGQYDATNCTSSSMPSIRALILSQAVSSEQSIVGGKDLESPLYVTWSLGQSMFPRCRVEISQHVIFLAAATSIWLSTYLSISYNQSFRYQTSVC
jgi:hypothetical protein